MRMRYKARRDPDPFPEGWYPAKLVKTEENVGEYGPYLKWEFRVTRNEEGLTVSCLTSAGFGSRSREYRMVSALLGHALKDGEVFDLESLWGEPCRVMVAVKESERGTFNRVVDVKSAQRSEIAEPETAEADVPF